MGSLVSYGLLCVLACLVALAAGRKALVASLAIAGSWGFYNSLWFENGLGFMLWGQLEPFGVDYVDIWSVTDLCVAAFVAYLAGWQTWGVSLWLLILVQMVFHVFHQFAGLGFSAYSLSLDALFLGQLAVFFVLGGGSCVALLSDYAIRARHLWNGGRKETAFIEGAAQ